MRNRIVAALIGSILSLPSGIRAQQVEDGATYIYPPRAAAIPALRRWFAADAAKSHAAIAASTTERHRAPTGVEYRRIQQWQVVADTPRLLSLSLATSEQGGAHPLLTSGSMVWDKAMAMPRSALSFFTSAAALDKAVRPDFCRRLDTERRGKRGDDDGGDFAPWKQCVDPAKTTLMLGSSSHKRFDRIGFLMDPYVAEPMPRVCMK